MQEAGDRRNDKSDCGAHGMFSKYRPRCEGILTVVITIQPLPQPWVETK